MPAVKRAVSFDKQTFRIVREHGKKVGVKPLSTALNSLILQFDQMQKATTPAAEPAQTPEPAPAVTAG